ncbi:YggS family pyridoxal phosphate-dependent enzyme [Geitlerinema sp. P-1104]|uniref:YggS family pyridoxal phosphate-dependent enzyme n=1 Tax=Geitlerinema sp. P-1104 TaxID=2546230 RepID=UPI0014770EF7|nr:YggS family pyridoxal phosphate-dependent enzyme [Geitlerinema sp. P-1104]NMG59125.1 YggS family pyridoxal phosphate-dependent enzyme [Geitlerinema sp. P-1104]
MSFEDLSIADRIAKIRPTLPESVRLIAVSKLKPASAIRQAYEAGIRDFGESRIQEAIAKQEELQDLEDITWHFIGHLQTNKAKLALERMQWIHSVDRLKLAREIQRLVDKGSPCPNLCLQVKFRPDANKSGWDWSELQQDLPQLDDLSGLKVQGLMTILPFGLPSQESQTIFREARQGCDRLQQQSWAHLQFSELSMGMSEDYPLAVEAGSTMVRLGRILFGDRPT